MLDPVMAADGNTYERVAIQQWLLHQRTSPMTRAALDFTDLYPNHEKKAEIERWMKSQKSGRLHAKPRPKTNRPLYKLTWATTAGQAVAELNNLILSVKIGGCELTQSQLNRIRRCLSGYPHVWTHEAQRKFQALEEECLRHAASSNSRDSEAAWLSNLSSEDSDQPFGSYTTSAKMRVYDKIQPVTDSDVTHPVPRSNQMQFGAHSQLDSSPAKLLLNQLSAHDLQTPWCNGQNLFDLTPPRADKATAANLSAAASARGEVISNLADGDDTEDFHECWDFLMTEQNIDIQVSAASHPGPTELCEPTNYEILSNSRPDAPCGNHQ